MPPKAPALLYCACRLAPPGDPPPLFWSVLHTGRPSVPMAESLSVPEHVNDFTPPSVDAAGFGRRAAGSVPLAMFAALVASVAQLAAESLSVAHAGRDFVMTPSAEIALM